jgi:transposase
MNFVGIDVSKDRLDVAVRPDGKRWSAANVEAEIGGIAEALSGLSPQAVVVEATGGM